MAVMMQVAAYNTNGICNSEHHLGDLLHLYNARRNHDTIPKIPLRKKLCSYLE